jgi:hypothetical protein
MHDRELDHGPEHSYHPDLWRAQCPNAVDRTPKPRVVGSIPASRATSFSFKSVSSRGSCEFESIEIPTGPKIL